MHDSTAVAGVGNVFMVLDDAQQVAFSGQDIATAIATKGVPQSLPGGYTAVDPGEARADLLRPVNSARGGITFVAILLWLVAATIIGSIIYMSVLERLRDFAVFKAVGVTTRAILGGLAAQAAVFALAAAAIGTVVGMLLAPAFPLRAEIPFAAFIWLPVLAVGVGVLASAIGMRRVVSVDPALAFGGP
jgi:putative ABC transport system permease protein